MTNKYTEELMRFSSEPLLNVGPPIDFLYNSIHSVLSKKNGFYAFGDALHFFPSGHSSTHMTFESWNRLDLWISSYGKIDNHASFFSEDIFGGQYCISTDSIYYFDPETGELEYFADGIESWAKKIIDDPEVNTGYPIAEQWQRQHGPLAIGNRLCPKIPFILGGAYTVDNLFSCKAEDGMKLRADVARQVKNLPDGATVQITISE